MNDAAGSREIGIERLELQTATRYPAARIGGSDRCSVAFLYPE
jgi:hypothetical protein